jgi:Copper type II ascorbate-dependent monooxygenase, C-terminal domain
MENQCATGRCAECSTARRELVCRLRGKWRVLATAMLWVTFACGSDDKVPPADAPQTTTAGASAGALPIAGSASVAMPAPPTNNPPGAATASAGPNTAGASGAANAAGASAPAIPSSANDAARPDGAVGDGVLPCAVSKVLATNCQSCHAAKPIAGAPMPLMTHADLHKPAVTRPSMKVYQLVKIRVHDAMRPMPPTTQLAPADVAALDGWIDNGAKSAPAKEATSCSASVPSSPGTTGQSRDGSTGALTPEPGETCYDFKTHQSTTMVDNTPYDVGPDGEHYEQFYFKVPWPKDQVATAYGTKLDNTQVLHHWLLFSTDEAEAEGFHRTAPLPTLIGTNPVLLAGWAVGGPNVVAPKDIGLELPGPGKQINVQWHFYNSTGTRQKDASAVQICTVPKTMVKNIGSITWLGTEDLGGNVWFGGPGMPPHQESTFTTICTPGRFGMGPQDSIHIIGFEPHMHRIGKRMTTSVIKTDGTTTMIFDKPFSFGNETHYQTEYELKPGEKLKVSCTFNNTNDFGVPFGESSDSEMCYQFTFAWPAHALSNGAPSLLGVTDTCW